MATTRCSPMVEAGIVDMETLAAIALCLECPLECCELDGITGISPNTLRMLNRKKRIMHLMAQGKRDWEIAEQLGVSIRTVRRRRKEVSYA